MPTIRITDRTWDKMNRIAKEMSESGNPEFKDILKITPDGVINELMKYWIEDHELKDFEAQIRKNPPDPELEKLREQDDKLISDAKTKEKMRKIQDKMYKNNTENEDKP